MSGLSRGGARREHSRTGRELRMPLGQRIAYMAPEGRPGIRNLCGELPVGAGDVLPKMKARNICAPASLACLGDPTEDGGEVVRRVSPAPDRLGRRFELAHGVLVQGGESRVQVLLDRRLALLHSSMRWSKSRLPGASSAFDSSTRISRSS
jgi:hypothetical protein